MTTRTTQEEWTARSERARTVMRSAMRRQARSQTEAQNDAAQAAVSRAAGVTNACRSRSHGAPRATFVA